MNKFILIIVASIASLSTTVSKLWSIQIIDHLRSASIKLEDFTTAAYLIVISLLVLCIGLFVETFKKLPIFSFFFLLLTVLDILHFISLEYFYQTNSHLLGVHYIHFFRYQILGYCFLPLTLLIQEQRLNLLMIFALMISAGGILNKFHDYFYVSWNSTSLKLISISYLALIPFFIYQYKKKSDLKENSAEILDDNS